MAVHRAPLTTAVLCFLHFGCSDSAPESTGEIDAEALRLLTIEEDARLGSVDDADYGFSRVGDVDVDRDGNLYVYESQDREIRVYGPDRRLLRRIGRRGQGPGEFSGTLVTFGIAGDTLWTFEATTRRLILFDRQGNVLSTVRVQDVKFPLFVEGQTATVVPYALGADGLFIGDRGGSSFVSRGGGSAAIIADTIHVPRVRFDAAGNVVDTASSYAVPRSDFATEFIDVGSSRYLMPQPPNDEPMRISVPDGSITVDRALPRPGMPATFRVTRLDLRNDTLLSRVFRYRPVGYPGVVLDSLALRRTRGSGNMIVAGESGTTVIQRHPADSAAAFAAIRDKMSFPEFQPAIQSYHLGDDDAIWLRREDTGGDVRRWILLDPRLEPIGQLDLPRRFRIAWSRADALWVVERDSLDVPWLVHYRVRERQ